MSIQGTNRAHRSFLSRLAVGVAFAIAGIMAAAPSQAASTTIDFHSVDATGSAVNAPSYLAGFGVTLSGVTGGTTVVIMDDANLYGGQPADPASAPNVLTQLGSNAPVTFTLNFLTALDSFAFTRPQLLPGPSGITHPAWQAYAYAGLTQIGVVSESLIASFSTVPAATYTLNGPGIATVQFDSQNGNFAAFSAVLLDNMVLTTQDGSAVPGPSSILLMASGLFGLSFAGRRKMTATIK